MTAANTGRLVERTFGIQLSQITTAAVHVLAVGKAADAMLAAWLARDRHDTRSRTAILPLRPAGSRADIEWIEAGHPAPDDRSLAAGERALAIARSVSRDETLVVLLSGGASALMCCPVAPVSLGDKREAARVLMAGGADIHALNCVRKHLSRVKGGWLAAACAGETLTLAVSDVVGDVPAVIGSGPTVADPTTYDDALACLDRYDGRAAYPATVREWLERGAVGAAPETPKPGDGRLARSTFFVIGSRTDALDGARREAQARGYDAHVIGEPVIGEARHAARATLETVLKRSAALRRPCCLVSGGETTVHVTGGGRGGRNQEFALALADLLSEVNVPMAVASVGTDGVDGPTDAAGAIVDTGTADRARRAGLAPASRYLGENDAYSYFDGIGDLVRTGPTATNVGDLQVFLIGG